MSWLKIESSASSTISLTDGWSLQQKRYTTKLPRVEARSAHHAGTSSTNSVYWFSIAYMGPRRDTYKRSSVRSRAPSHDVAFALPPWQTWPCLLRDVPHWATVLSPWPVHVLGTLCLMRSVGAHHLTLSNVHWKLVYTFRAISNATTLARVLLWHL